MRDGETGFLVESRDLDAMADRIEQLARDADLRRQMGLAAAKHVREQFDSRLLAARIEDLYDRLVATG